MGDITLTANPLAPSTTRARARGLSTARAVLQLLSLLAESTDGVRASDVAERLGKSTSTAYNLLDTLCDAGYANHSGDGTYHLAARAAHLVPEAGHDLPASLTGIVDELFARTHKRAYLAGAHSGQILIVREQGRQGMPLIPNLGTRITLKAHALALGKVALALASERTLARYLARGLPAFTPATITSPDALECQLSDIRDGAVAFACEEFSADSCCLAVPLRNAAGDAVAVLGVSMSVRCFELEREVLSDALREVAKAGAQTLPGRPVPAISEDPIVLEPPQPTSLESAAAAVFMSVSTERNSTS
jgi:DNA-binding IclR family transcriptional regulator